MKHNILADIHAEVKRELETCTNFWLANGKDEKNGGVYTCLDMAGDIYSTDKSVWMQGRCAWLFSHLCNVYGERVEWRNFAESCLDFSEKNCINRDAENRMYFTVTAEGQPLRQRRYCFSEAFYTMANAEHHALTGDKKYLKRARNAWELVWKLNNGLMVDPTGLGAKTCPETRRGRALADPMIYLNISMVLRRSDPANANEYMARAKECVGTILKYHHKPELKATLETVGMQGEFLSDISAGRVLNPGHAIECSWFMLEYAKEAKDEETACKAIEMFDFAYENGWDTDCGGLLYYTDVLGKPPEAYEHDMKLWWPHNELLIAALMIYQHTGQERYLNIFTETWEYCMRVFCAPEGEWYGYLRKDGKPTLPAAKGSTFKGPFHLPRMLVKLDTLLPQVMR